jgi:hypothetical protein
MSANSAALTQIVTSGLRMIDRNENAEGLRAFRTDLCLFMAPLE